MAFKIHPNGNIELIRGDSMTIVVNLSNGGIPYEFGVNDKLTMTVKENTNASNYVLQKIVTRADYDKSGKCAINIRPDDTTNLRFKPYTYDIQLSMNSGERVDTVISPKDFIILEEVTWT